MIVDHCRLSLRRLAEHPDVKKMPKSKTNRPANTIALNKKVRYDYFIEERLEAGIALEGWEVKSLRAGRVQLKESYVVLKGNEIWLIGAHISPLSSASTHVDPDPVRTRKLLMRRKEINWIIGIVERRGYTLVPTAMYWKRGRAKLEIGTARGKKKFDKRAAEKDRDWAREKQRILKTERF
uniref:SsrA-binding protein n=2 Tax=Candidatus Kentrum sp. LFY TaxID=2126342 RepID=A0A450WFA4_9GAMM|nr:MAG: SsrA-binding protein [Candidatus Kentron sp. LFY]